MKSETVAVEFDKANRNFYFPPLGQKLRGRFDLHRVREPLALMAHSEWPEAIPGSVLEYDPATGMGSIVEPLHQPRYAAVRESIEKRGMKLPDERQPISCDVPTMIYWISGAVAAGDAKLISGTLPEVTGTPKTRFHSSEQPDSADRLAAAVEAQAKALADQNELQRQLIAAIGELAKRK